MDYVKSKIVNKKWRLSTVMKKYAILVFTLFFQCEKSDIAMEEIYGDWRWVQSSGGFANIIYEASNPDQRVVSFGQDGTFKMVYNKQEIVYTTFSIALEKSISHSEKVEVINYANQAIRQSFTIKNDSLTLFDEVYDGFTHLYLRK